MNFGVGEKILLTILTIAGSFYEARCMLFGLLCPIGCAYLALMLSKGSFYFALAAAMAGVATRSVSGDIHIGGYKCAFIGLGLVNAGVKCADLSLTPMGKALVSGLCMLMGGLTGAVIEGFSTYMLIISVLQALLSAVLTIVFYEGIRALKKGGGNELYGGSLLIGCICGGMDNIAPFGIPLSLVSLALLLPTVMGKRVLTGSDGTYLRQLASNRLEGFAGTMDNLASSLKAVTDTINEEVDSEQLKKNLKKSRALLSEELTCVSALIKGLSGEITGELAPDVCLGRDLKKRLKGVGIACSDVMVYTCDSDKYEVNIVRKCRRNCSKCLKQTIALVSRELGVKMTREGDFCGYDSDSNKYTLKLCRLRPYRISAYGAVKKRDGSAVSGDSHTFMELKYGKYMLALSDGMGSGGKAREESAASVELFEDFMEAGFDRDLALEQINSLLLMKAGNEDIFATMDICNVDLYSGRAEFVKIGGMPSFIAGSSGVKLIGSGGLPIGIIDNMERESVEIQLKSGDTIVMVTDGVAEAAPCAIGKESWLAGVIDENAALPPEKLCNAVLEAAIEADGGKISDDMTVIAARGWRI